MSAPRLSVIVCTHNPRREHLSRTLAALRSQAPALAEWELLIIDNASTEPLQGRLDLTWHPAARIVPEPALGVTAARVRGIQEARAELILFVDDDNVLAEDYFARTFALEARWPQLGAWGCGDFVPEWETPPPAHFAGYLSYLAVNRAPRDRWSNQLFDYAATPPTAGMCVRAPVARGYAERVKNDPRRRALGRNGAALTACEDHDLAFTAIELGLGIGVFTELRITHLMPAARVQEPYLLRLVEGHAYSAVLLHALWTGRVEPPARGALAWLRAFRLRRSLNPIDRKIHDARHRGEARAVREIGAASAWRA